MVALKKSAKFGLERIAVRYRPLPPVVDAEKAAELDAALLPLRSARMSSATARFATATPEAAFVAVAHRVSVTTRYPRNAASLLECSVVIAEYLPGEAAYEVTANFQGPFATHPVMAMALGVPGNRLRLRTPPHSGGSFGAKHAVFPISCCWRWRRAEPDGRSNRSRAASSTSSPPRRRPTG
jgi:2-furoyl-CoA dehydrogenase large subunit